MNSVVAPLTAVVDAAAFLQCRQAVFVALEQKRQSGNDDVDELSSGRGIQKPQVRHR